MSEPLLNVVIIAKKNTSLRFKNTLESIINQEYKPVNVIVVDTNEQDSDYSLGLQEDLSAYKNIEYLKVDSSVSTAKIRNIMLKRLEGDYIAFLTGNDTWDIRTAQAVIKEFEENPDINAVCINGKLTDERQADISEEPLIESLVYDRTKWVFYNPAKISSQVIYRTAGILEAGGFDEGFDLLCDADMLLRLSKNNTVLIKADFMCECRIGDSYADYDLKLFYELKIIRIKYIDLYVHDRILTQKFYEKMTELAGKNYLWLDFALFNALCFVNAPYKTFCKTLSKIGRFLRFVVLWIRREISIVKERISIRYRIINHKTLNKKIHTSDISGMIGDKNDISFISARDYNERSSFDYAFNKKIRKVIIPEHVKTIKKGMFYGCENLVSVEIPASVTRIEDHAFHNCINLRYVKFGDNSRLSKIGNYAFAGCSSLEEINIAPVTEIGSFAFARCCSLKTLSFAKSRYFSSGIEKLSRYVFAGCTNLSSVEFENNSLLEVIEDKAFFGCSSLKKILITGRVKKIGNYAFAYCSELESVAILNIDTIETIGKGAFMHCKKLPYFQFPSGIKRIRHRTFYGCLRLKSVKIPKKILSINYQAFGKCPMLKSAVILSGDVMISAKAFEKHTKIQIKDSLNTNQIYRA